MAAAEESKHPVNRSVGINNNLPHPPRSSSDSPAAIVPKLDLKSLDSDEEGGRRPHPLDMMDSYDMEASDKDTGLGPSYHSDRAAAAPAPAPNAESERGRADDRGQGQSQRGQGRERRSRRSSSGADNSSSSGDRRPAGSDVKQDDDLVALNLADPDDVTRKLSKLHMTEEEEEALLQQAYEVNRALRSQLNKMMKGGGGGRGETEDRRDMGMTRARTMYSNGNGRVGRRPLPPLQAMGRGRGAQSAAVRIPHPPGQLSRKTSAKTRQRGPTKAPAPEPQEPPARRVPRPEWNGRFTAA